MKGIIKTKKGCEVELHISKKCKKRSYSFAKATAHRGEDYCCAIDVSISQLHGVWGGCAEI